MIKNCNSKLTNAIKENKVENWRDFRNCRNNLQKVIKRKKKDYLKSKFDHTKDKWKFLKKFNKKEVPHPPRQILRNGESITSPKQIAEYANTFFIEKVKKIRAELPKINSDPIEILSKLIPRCNDTFNLPFITIEQTKKIIRKLKNSNSTGFDRTNSRIIKKLCDDIAPHITHLINCIIRTKKYPNIFKITRMLPLSKPGKDTCMIDSFRPINNLVILEKIVEEWIKESLIEFLETNNILSKNHHGGRAAHSTITAKTQIDQKLHKNYENDKITAVLATDLSAAYDTVDHEILLKKLEHYGVRGGELELFKNYLKDRKQFVEVDTFRSPILDSPEASVIQGSKMSGLLYNLYTNEVPLLYKLVHNTWFEKITNTKKYFSKI